MQDHHSSRMSKALLYVMVDSITKKMKSKVAVKAARLRVSGKPQNGNFLTCRTWWRKQGNLINHFTYVVLHCSSESFPHLNLYKKKILPSLTGRGNLRSNQRQFGAQTKQCAIGKDALSLFPLNAPGRWDLSTAVNAGHETVDRILEGILWWQSQCNSHYSIGTGLWYFMSNEYRKYSLWLLAE